MPYFNYIGQAMPESASPTNNVFGTSAGGETLTAPAGPSSVDSGGGFGDVLVGSNGDNIFYVKDPSDVVRVDPGLSGIKTAVVYSGFILPDNVQNLTSSGAFDYAVGNNLDNLIIVGNDTETLDGGPGNDVLVGGGGANTFVVRAGEGNDVIYGWNSRDQVELGGTAFKSFADVQAAMKQVGSDVVLQIDPNETLTFRGVTPSTFAASNFLLPLDRSKLGAITFQDDFNSLQLYNFSTNTGKWQATFGFDPHNVNNYSLTGNGEAQVYTTADFQGTADHPLGYNPFSVSNGVLTITAQPIAAADQSAAWGHQFASGLIDTRGVFEQKYGYFEIRMALPTTATGSWPAFWMVPDPNPNGIEADITENLAINPNIDFVRGWDGSGAAVAFSNAFKPGDVTGFHTYGLMWTPQTITFYYDDTAVYSAPTPSTWTQPMYLIANFAVGGFGGTPEPWKFPASVQIDYIRAYAMPDGSSTVENLTPLAPGGTLRINGGVTAGEPALTTQTFDSDGVTAVTTQKVVEISTDPQHASQSELNAAGDKALLLWNSGGAVFASYKNGSTYSQATPVAVGTVESLQMKGGFLSDGKVALDWIETDNGQQMAWADVLNPSDMSLQRQQLGPATGGITEAATAHGGFAISWHNGSQIEARGYDGYGYYGQAVTTQGDVAGIDSAGDVVVAWADAAGQHSQLYDVLADPFNQHTASPPPVSPPPVSPPPVSPPPVSPPPTSPPPVSPPPVSPPPSSGQTLTSSGSSNLMGGSGADTLVASTGPDTLTGAGGADHFVWKALPWQAGQVTDFTPGVDKLDVSALLTNSGYAGADPIGDGYVKLIDDGKGDTWFYFDTDGKGTADQWGTFVATLEHVTPGQISDADLIFSGTASPPPVSPPPVSPPPVSPPPVSPPPVSPPPVSPPPGSGQTLTSSGSSNLVGGSGADTLVASTGPDTLTGAGGADHFVFSAAPWQAGHITDFTPGVDKIDVSGMLGKVGYSGTNAIADGYIKLIDDGHGDTWVYFDSDGPGNADPWGTFVTTLDHVTPGQISASDWIFH